VTVAKPPFQKILSSYVFTVTGSIHIKFKVRAFNRFGDIDIEHRNWSD